MIKMYDSVRAQWIQARTEDYIGRRQDKSLVH
jgi:hypothetical protein